MGECLADSSLHTYSKSSLQLGVYETADTWRSSRSSVTRVNSRSGNATDSTKNRPGIIIITTIIIIVTISIIVVCAV